jgi:hypothetical protein
MSAPLILTPTTAPAFPTNLHPYNNLRTSMFGGSPEGTEQAAEVVAAVVVAEEEVVVHSYSSVPTIPFDLLQGPISQRSIGSHLGVIPKDVMTLFRPIPLWITNPPFDYAQAENGSLEGCSSAVTRVMDM